MMDNMDNFSHFLFIFCLKKIKYCTDSRSSSILFIVSIINNRVMIRFDVI
jgi:hypothetical protein